jgi:hypothetical protein
MYTQKSLLLSILISHFKYILKICTYVDAFDCMVPMYLILIGCTLVAKDASLDSYEYIGFLLRWNWITYMRVFTFCIDIRLFNYTFLDNLA